MSTLLLEAAACMWEQALNLINTDPAWTSFQEGFGYACARMEVIQHAHLLEADWHDDYDRCFDWDFVPAWMNANLVLDLNTGSITVRESRHIP